MKPARGTVREAGEWIQHRGREARGQIYLSSNSTKGAKKHLVDSFQIDKVIWIVNKHKVSRLDV